MILFCIAGGVDRFGTMPRSVPGIAKQMLTQQLRRMEVDGLVERTVFALVPSWVDHALTERGQSLLVVVSAMRDRGAAFREYRAERKAGSFSAGKHVRRIEQAALDAFVAALPESSHAR